MSEVKAILVFCEGSHDIAFVQKVLTLCLGFKKRRWKFSEYPSPFNLLFKMSVQDHASGDLRLEIAHDFFLPNSVLQKAEHLVLLFNCGGSSKKDKVKSLLKQFLDLLESMNEGILNSEVFFYDTQSVVKEVKYLFLYDADCSGTTALFKKIKKDFEVIDKETQWSFNDLNVEDNPFGAIADDKAAYVWGENEKTGTLEDILLPMFEHDQKVIFDKASQFVDTSFKWEIEAPKLKEKIAEIANRKKAIITCIGQGKKPGFSVNVIIDQAKLIKDDTFLQNSSVKSFADFINKFMGTIQKTIGVCVSVIAIWLFDALIEYSYSATML
jgi:hypothetical protein